MSEQTSLDPRVRRSRARLQDALVQLTLEHGYASFGIEDILERADVARATFYTHYRGKDDLLDAVVDETFGDLRTAAVEVLDAEFPDFFTLNAMRTLFRRSVDHAAVLRLVLRGEGDGRPLWRMLEDLAVTAQHWHARRLQADGHEARVPLPLLARQFAWTVAAVLTWWLEEEPDRSPDDVAELYRQLAWPTLARVLDVELELPD